MAMLSRIFQKSSLIRLVNTTTHRNITTYRNYSSAIFPVPLKNSIINRSSSCCGSHLSREVVFPRTSVATLHSFSSFSKPRQADDDKRTTLASTTGSTATKTIAMPMTSTVNFISRRFSTSRGNTATNVFVRKPEGEILESSSASKFSWKIKNFSKIDSIVGFFSTFNVGNSHWQACIYPKGEPTEVELYGHSLSLYLWPVNWTGPEGYVKFKIYMTDQNTQKSIKIADGEFECCGDFEYFWDTLMPLAELHDPVNGYLLNGTCIFEIEIEVSYKMREENSYASDMKERNPEVQEAKRQHKFSKFKVQEAEQQHKFSEYKVQEAKQQHKHPIMVTKFKFEQKK